MNELKLGLSTKLAKNLSCRSNCKGYIMKSSRKEVLIFIRLWFQDNGWFWLMHNISLEVYFKITYIVKFRWNYCWFIYVHNQPFLSVSPKQYENQSSIPHEQQLWYF